MKILILTDSLNRGGAEKQLVLLARKLVKTYDVMVWSLHTGPFIDDLIQGKVEVKIHKGISTCRSVYIALSKIITNFSPDVAHFWGVASLFAGYLPFKIAGIPIVNGTIRYGIRPKGLKRNLHISLAANIGDTIVANSTAGLNSSRTKIKRKYVIHNGFDFTSLNSISKIALKKELTTVSMCANITKNKDYAMYIDTAKRIFSTNARQYFQFLAIGSPSSAAEMSKVNTRAANMTASGFFRFTGGVSNPLPYLLTSSIGVLLSTNGEGISNSIMEYMACRIPVICSLTGGNMELVHNNVNGFLVNPKNSPDEISDRILWLFNNPEKAKQMGETGSKILSSEFSVEKMVNSTINVYKEIL